MIKNKVIAICGGAGNIGKRFSEAVIENGGKVIIADIDKNNGNKLVKKINNNKAVYFFADITNPNSIEELIKFASKKFSKIDCAVNCAYPLTQNWGNKFEEVKLHDLNMSLNHQLGGAIMFSQKMIKYFRSQKFGNLLHISSIQGIQAPKFDHYKGTNMTSPIEYTAIKAGIVAITKYLAKYCKNQNIRVNCISPGGILDDQPLKFRKKYKESCLNKGMLTSSDLVGTFLFLMSDLSQYLNGQNIVVDDGWSL